VQLHYLPSRQDRLPTRLTFVIEICRFNKLLRLLITSTYRSTSPSALINRCLACSEITRSTGRLYKPKYLHPTALFTAVPSPEPGILILSKFKSELFSEC
jgi:hypothetical protein